MTDIILDVKDTVDVITDIQDFINNTFSGVSGSPIIDPFTDSGETRPSGTGLAVYEDETLSFKQLPKITFETVDLPRSRQAGGKSVYREQLRHEFAIIYDCGKDHKWTFDSTEYVGKRQCIRYLQYLGDQIKKYSGSFPDFNEVVIGSVANPVANPQTHGYRSFLMISVNTYGRTGPTS